MKDNRYQLKPLACALALAGLGVPLTASALDLAAVESTWNGIPMWGFVADPGSCPGVPGGWAPGPQITDLDLLAGDLTINLRNCLSVPVSIVIPGQPATFSPVIVGGRVTAFTNEAPADNGTTTTTYTWTGVRPGTYLYQSGSHPALQVQMGLYGAMTIGSYPDTSADVTLLYSEIDPVLHADTDLITAGTQPTAATPRNYHPTHFLVNGSDANPAIAAGDTNQPTVLRMLNAGLDFRVAALNGGYMELMAEDGNAYLYPKTEAAANLPAGKTIDALWLPGSAGDTVIYDRRGGVMFATLSATAGVGAPIANDDAYLVAEDGVLNVAAIGVLGNDTDDLSAPLTVPPASAAPVSSTAAGSLALNADGSFTYTPNVNFNGTDSFTYKANDGTLDSNVATVTITVTAVNDAPSAVADSYDATEGTTLNVAAPGLLGNDSDIDGDALTVTTTPLSGPASGSLTLNADGSFDYTPSVAAPASDTFTYQVCDAEPLCATAAVSINIVAAVNSPPVAVEDFPADVPRNSPGVFINLTDNDTDADGNLKDGLGNVAPGQITITTGASTTRGGTVSVVTNGVNYTPKRNFRGTDTFNYTVTDLDGAVSNEVTVRINVVR